MPTLDDFPPYRRAKLLWEFAHFGEYGINQRIREATGESCPLSGVPKPSSPRMAVLGGDGRHHLMSDGEMVCARGRTEQGWEHRQYCCWTDTSSGPFEGHCANGTYESIEHTWIVQTVAESALLSFLPLAQRCLGGDYTVFMHYWPPPPARTAHVRRLRAALTEALGPDCHLCGALPGAMVDHDYSTGMVRGLLCKLCNRTVEECPHLDGCPKADYMNNPPAAKLALHYPPHLAYKPTASARAQKVELLGFDPLAEWRPARP
ncbi:endonuclease domain-containing protein [Streptomyces sp. NPDC001668]|uniref:endonuclease domain-containing protein n=1 Tax=unclassified Streptomyces TaxID=2593676 RepID=UPI00369DB0AE